MNIVNLNNKVIEYVLGYDSSDEVKQKLRNLDGSLSDRKIADFGFVGVDGMMFVMNSNDRGQYYFSGPITMDEASSYVAMKFKINTIPYVLNVARITELNTTSVTESQFLNDPPQMVHRSTITG